jgi:hypothetical protein
MAKITPVVDGEEYEIRTMPDQQAQQLVVAIFKGNQRIGPRYMVSFETAGDFNYYTGDHALEELVKLAKNDLDSGVVRPAQTGAVSRVHYRGAPPSACGE